MDVEKVAAKVTQLIEELYTDAVQEGRDLEFEDLMIAMKNRRPSPRSPHSEPPGANGPVNDPRPEPPQPPVNSISQRIEAALLELATEDGVYPDNIADHTGIKVREVRATLRNMVLSGDAFRKARGKYAPAMPLIMQANKAAENQPAT